MIDLFVELPFDARSNASMEEFVNEIAHIINLCNGNNMALNALVPEKVKGGMKLKLTFGTQSGAADFQCLYKNNPIES